MPYTPLQGSFEKARRAEAAGRLRGYRRRLRQFKEDPHRGRTATAAAGTTLAEKDHALAAIRQGLRAPVNDTAGRARVARTAPAGGAESGEALARIERSARLLAALVNDILDLVKSAKSCTAPMGHLEPADERRQVKAGRRSCERGS
jgi:signal transduction histidine kinase